MSTQSDGKSRGGRASVEVRGASGRRGKLPDKSMTAAQRRGLARRITAYLKRSGFDCELIGERRRQPRTLN